MAHLLTIKPEEIDKKILKQATSIEATGGRGHGRNSRDYWDAFSHCGQIPGNVPKWMSIALIYNWLTE